MARVVASARIPAPVAAILGPEIDYLEPERELSREQLLSEIATADGLISLLTVSIDDELLAAAPRLRVIANYAVGYDNIDVVAATRRGIAVCNTPGVLTDATADFTWALILAAARRITSADAMVRSGTWPGWFPDQHLGVPVAGRTLGIIGLGRIGQAVARRARGFGMTILYSGPREVPEAPELGARRVPLRELLATSHVVSIHCPQTDETHHLIDAGALAEMRRDAILVNTARGPIVDENALVEALSVGRPYAAALDVYEHEPHVAPGLIEHPRAVLAPHLGSATTAARRAMGELCATAVRAVLAGERPGNQINDVAAGGGGPS